MEGEKGYKRLLAWKKANEFAKQVYRETKNFPKEEIYGLTSQLRRAALSVVLNLVEGSGRQSQNEMKRFVTISLGSLAESEYLIEFALEMKYLDEAAFKKLEILRAEAGAIIWTLYKRL